MRLQRFILLHMVLPAVLLTGCGAAGEQAGTPTPTVSEQGADDATAAARQLLTQYFELLNKGSYDEASQLYGGSYETLQTWNPEIDANDHVKLWEAACTRNGLNCLKVKNVVSAEKVASGEYKFKVEFAQGNGNLFVQGPCCGATETEQPSRTQFDYTVKKVDTNFLVQELPVYTP